MDYNLLTLAGAALIGAVVGSLTGIFGVGGGFLMTPCLMIFLGIPGPLAVGTDLATILANSSLAMIKRRGSGTIDLKLALVVSCGSVVGVLLGSYFLEVLKGIPSVEIFGRPQNPVQFSLLLLFLLVLAGIGSFLLFENYLNRARDPVQRIGLFAKVKIPPFLHFQSLKSSRLSVITLVGLGLWVGIMTGLMGIGGGVILLPALVYLVGQRTQQAVGTSLVLVWISSLVAVIRKGPAGEIDPLLLAALLLGGLIGTFVGTHIGLKLTGPKIRSYFVYVILAAILIVGYRLLKLII